MIFGCAVISNYRVAVRTVCFPMVRSMDTLETIAFALDSGLLVLIWLVQLVIYPALLEVEAERFPAWHGAYSRRVSWVVIPLMFGQLGVTIAIVAAYPSLVNWLATFFVVLAWASTFLQAVPLHGKLSRVGFDRVAVNELIRVNWIRVAAWSSVWLASVVRIWQSSSR